MEKVKKKRFDGTEVEVLGETYEEGTPAEVSDPWRKKLVDRVDMIKYLKSSQRYWYSDSGYGSEKRKNPA